jgi:hypothetical protein
MLCKAIFWCSISSGILKIASLGLVHGHVDPDHCVFETDWNLAVLIKGEYGLEGERKLMNGGIPYNYADILTTVGDIQAFCIMQFESLGG